MLVLSLRMFCSSIVVTINSAIYQLIAMTNTGIASHINKAAIISLSLENVMVTLFINLGKTKRAEHSCHENSMLNSNTAICSAPGF